MRVEIVFESANQRAHIRSSDPRKDESKLSGQQYCGSQSVLSIMGDDFSSFEQGNLS
jgi:hypothetical protein